MYLQVHECSCLKVYAHFLGSASQYLLLHNFNGWVERNTIINERGRQASKVAPVVFSSTVCSGCIHVYCLYLLFIYNYTAMHATGSRCVQCGSGDVGGVGWPRAVAGAAWPRPPPCTGGEEDVTATRRGAQGHCPAASPHLLPSA